MSSIKSRNIKEDRDGAKAEIPYINFTGAIDMADAPVVSFHLILGIFYFILYFF